MDSNAVSIFAPYYEVDDTAFITKIGNTIYEVVTLQCERKRNSIGAIQRTLDRT